MLRFFFVLMHGLFLLSDFGGLAKKYHVSHPGTRAFFLKLGILYVQHVTLQITQLRELKYFMLSNIKRVLVECVQCVNQFHHNAWANQLSGC